MEKLQNNYTTPEQSKRLLKLGIPAYSADCYYSSFIKTYSHSDYKEQIWHRPRFITKDNQPDFSAMDLYGYTFYFPCWSIGRLMEIITLCHLSRDGRFCFRENMCELLVESICEFVKYGEMDFSKLEE